MGSDVIKVTPDALESAAKALEGAGSRLGGAASSLGGVRLSYGNGSGRPANAACSLTAKGDGISGSTVGSALKEYTSALSWYAEHLQNLAKGVRKAAVLFEECERNVISAIAGGVEGETHWELGELAEKVIGKAGYAGSLLTAVWNLQDPTSENVLKSGATIAKTAAKWFESNRKLNIVARSSTDFADGLRNKKLFGLDKYLKQPSRAKSGIFGKGAAFRADWANSFREGMAKTSAWIGAGITAGFDNYEEYKTGAISSDRAVAEWAVETVGTVALNAAATAAVGAGLAAVGFAGAPVLAVGAIAAGALWLVDGAWSATVGKVVGQSDKDEGIVETIGFWSGELWDLAKNQLNKATGAEVAPASDVSIGRKLSTGFFY